VRDSFHLRSSSSDTDVGGFSLLQRVKPSQLRLEAANPWPTSPLPPPKELYQELVEPYPADDDLGRGAARPRSLSAENWSGCRCSLGNRLQLRGIAGDSATLVEAPERHHCYELQIGVGHLGWNVWVGNDTRPSRHRPAAV